MAKQINFEEMLKRLNTITEDLEKGTLPLDESISLYEEGNKIIKELEKALSDAEAKIAEIVDTDTKVSKKSK